MVYIGFSNRTHKLYARILCKNFKHCAPVVIHNKHGLLYQFAQRNKIDIIPISNRDLSILNKYGWKFIKYNHTINPPDKNICKSLTCVQFTKQFCKIKNKYIQTPDGLFRYVTKK